VTSRETWAVTTRSTRVIGEQLLGGLVPLADRILQVSGRLSFEIVQKAAVAGIPIVERGERSSSWRSMRRTPRDHPGGFVRDGPLQRVRAP